MKRSTERIITSHAGTLPRPQDLREMVVAKDRGDAVDEAVFQASVRNATVEAIQKQIECGIDIPNDGELSKIGFSNYVRDRMTGVEQRPFKAGDRTPGISGRDVPAFPGYFESRGGFGESRGGFGRNAAPPPVAALTTVCVGPIAYKGQTTVAEDIANLKAAIQGTTVDDAFLPAIAPGTVEHWLRNEYYPTDEAFLMAVADALHEEYKAIVDGGFIIQIDDPDLPDAWQIHPELDIPGYQRFANLRVEALNHALRDLPEDRIRFHTCWGSYHGPHLYDIPLSDIADLILTIHAEVYSIEASNPRHDHEWRVWEDVKLPTGKVLMPGVIGHASDFIEHPELVADRLVRYAKIVGRENVVAGTDCGIGSRVGHPKVCWAKFEAMAEGARLATKQLWG